MILIVLTKKRGEAHKKESLPAHTWPPKIFPRIENGQKVPHNFVFFRSFSHLFYEFGPNHVPNFEVITRNIAWRVAKLAFNRSLARPSSYSSKSCFGLDIDLLVSEAQKRHPICRGMRRYPWFARTAKTLEQFGCFAVILSRFSLAITSVILFY